MEPTNQDVRGVIDTYIRAWVEQDPDLITTIFTETATYHERVLDEPIRDHTGIREYWHTKVLRSQRNITCKLLNLYLEGNTAIAEWQAEFDDVEQQVRKQMREIAVLVFEGNRISSLREYWASKAIGRPLPTQ